MHTDLSPHLHSPECNAIIADLKRCHKENTFSKFLGACNVLDARMLKCLKNERLARREANRLKAIQKEQEHIRKRKENKYDFDF